MKQNENGNEQNFSVQFPDIYPFMKHFNAYYRKWLPNTSFFSKLAFLSTLCYRIKLETVMDGERGEKNGEL